MVFIRVVRNKAIAEALHQQEATQWAPDTPTARHWHKVFVWIENAKFGRGTHWLEQREHLQAEQAPGPQPASRYPLMVVRTASQPSLGFRPTRGEAIAAPH